MVSRSQSLAKSSFVLIVGTLAWVGADAGGAELPEGLGELVAQPLIVSPRQRGTADWGRLSTAARRLSQTSA